MSCDSNQKLSDGHVLATNNATSFSLFPLLTSSLQQPSLTGKQKTASRGIIDKNTSDLKSKRLGIFSQFLDESLLESAQSPGLLRIHRKNLETGDKQVFTECQAQDVQVLTTVTERAGQGHED